MTREEIMGLGFEGLEERKAAIAIETDSADAEVIETLNAELEMIEERKRILDLEIEEQRKAAEAVAAGAGKEIETRKEDKKMTNLEVRNSKEYIEAFAKYVKTGRDMECRALFSENVDPNNMLATDSTVPVPTFVDEIIRAAWDNDKIYSRARKSFFRGNLKVGFEAYASGAAIHAEGGDAPEEEALTIGIVDLIPKMVKKWINVSDEALAIGPEGLLRFLYDEFAYRIIQRVSDEIVNAIVSAPGTSDATHVGVPQVPGAVSPATIIDAIAKLGDSARDLVFIASGATIAEVKKAALNAGYAYDPFMGLTVIAKEGVTGAIVGDLAGVQVNLPEGGDIKFKFDDLSLATDDLVKIIGRLFVAVAVTGPGMFAYITDESASGSAS